MSVDKKMLILIVMFAIAGGWIQSLASNGDHIQQVHEIILMICVCLAIMAVIIFWDYTVIGKYPIVLWVILCLLPSAAVVTARSLSLGDITGNNFGRFVVSGLLLPAYSAIVYHYRNKGYWGITCCIAWLLLGLGLNNTNVFRNTLAYQLVLLLGGVLLLTYAIAKGWYRIRSRRKGILAVWGSLALVGGIVLSLALPYIFPKKGFLDPYNADLYMTIRMRDALNGIRFWGAAREMDLALTLDPVPVKGATTFFTVLTKFGIAAGILLIASFLVLLVVMIVGVNKQKNVLGNMVIISCILGIFLPMLLHIMINMTILPFGDIFLPFCYPGWAVNGACYVMAGIYLSVYRKTDLAAE